jgi:hypothetical protein
MLILSYTIFTATVATLSTLIPHHFNDNRIFDCSPSSPPSPCSPNASMYFPFSGPPNLLNTPTSVPSVTLPGGIGLLKILYEERSISLLYCGYRNYCCITNHCYFRYYDCWYYQHYNRNLIADYYGQLLSSLLPTSL